MTSAVLVTGGAGYIGSHIVAALARAGRASVILDNFQNSSPGVVERLGRLAGAPVPLVEGDVRDAGVLRATFAAHRIGAVVHCAGMKAVGESSARPLAYWDVNLNGTVRLAEAMGEAGVATLVFSSSCTVYGQPDALPVGEDAPLRPASVYGRTKRAVEEFLRDLAGADARWRIAILRYMNPAGAHPSALIGEAPLGRPNNLVPLMCRAVAGEFDEVPIFGTDWPTPDGTGIRDYIHVDDLAEGHLAALDHLGSHPGVLTLNLGAGRGYSVLEVVGAFEKACGRPVPRVVAPRRDGDIASVYADASRALALLGWRATRGLDAICEDAWRWQRAGGRYA